MKKRGQHVPQHEQAEREQHAALDIQNMVDRVAHGKKLKAMYSTKEGIQNMNKAERTAINTNVQSTAAENAQVAMALRTGEPTRFQLRLMIAVMEDLSNALITGSPPSAGAPEAVNAMEAVIHTQPISSIVATWTSWELAGISLLVRLRNGELDACYDANHWVEATERGLK